MSRCPICKKKPSAEAFRPFCSKRCADIDLGKWLKGSYMVPGEDGEAEKEAAEAAAAAAARGDDADD